MCVYLIKSTAYLTDNHLKSVAAIYPVVG